jgi:cellulose synthase/poly-beta-1,6-N-acetylglucosamine synthase-like glycosyltransferase
MTTFRLPLAAIAFWVCVAAVLYAYVGYPLAIWCLSRRFAKTFATAAADPEPWPMVSLVIAAHNEEAVIEGRVRNALALDYPADRLEILIASDGSTDRTAELVRHYTGRGVRLLDFAHNRGKAATLNAAVAEAKGEVLVLSDANTNFDAPALKRLVRRLHDPHVGVVCGRLILVDPATGKNVDGMYWKYETFLKQCEGRLGALLGSNGAIYAIRRELYTPLPAGTLVDDFILPLLSRLRTDCEIVYARGAVAREETAPDVGCEFHRRARIGAGGFQSLGLLWRLLDPRRGWVAFTFTSHKVLRWLCPFFLIGALATNLVLWQEPLYRLTLLGQVAFYQLSAVAALLPARARLLRPLRLTTMFTSMNAALLMGFLRWLRGNANGVWQRTPRLTGMDGALR